MNLYDKTEIWVMGIVDRIIIWYLRRFRPDKVLQYHLKIMSRNMKRAGRVFGKKLIHIIHNVAYAIEAFNVNCDGGDGDSV